MCPEMTCPAWSNLRPSPYPALWSDPQANQIANQSQTDLFRGLRLSILSRHIIIASSLFNRKKKKAHSLSTSPGVKWRHYPDVVRQTLSLPHPFLPGHPGDFFSLCLCATSSPRRLGQASSHAIRLDLPLSDPARTSQLPGSSRISGILGLRSWRHFH